MGYTNKYSIIVHINVQNVIILGDIAIMTLTMFLFYIVIIRKKLYSMNKLGNIVIY